MRLDLSQSYKSGNIDSTSSSKQFVFTVLGDKISITPEVVVVPETVALTETSSKHLIDLRALNQPDDQVHIEIFREKSISSDGSINTVDINCISSAYRIFWQEDFQRCIEKRTCIECSQIFLTPQQLVYHIQHSHQILNPLECFICHHVFTNEIQRRDHFMLSHALDRNDLTCEVCFMQFGSESEKEDHRSIHQLTKKCQWCAASFPCQYLLNIHLQTCSFRRNDLVCQICGFNFRTSHVLMLHSSRHSRTACEICHRIILSETNPCLEDSEITFIRHLRSVHSADEINDILLSFKKQDEEENSLDELCYRQENLHQLTDPNFSDQVDHLEVKQTGRKELFGIQDSFVADDESTLNSVFQRKTISDFCQHTEQQLASPPINTCEERHPNNLSPLHCSPMFESKEIQTLQLETHNETILQPFKNNKEVDSKEELAKHSADSEKPFSCEECHRKFSYLRQYKKHMRSHGILVKPATSWYKCNQCAVRCSSSSGLRTHVLTHTNHRPYLCEKCGLRFRRHHALKAHGLAVHNLRNLHYCPQCESSSLSRTSLLRHIQCVHGGIRRFICGLCGARWLQNQDLRRHLQVKHNLDVPPLDCLAKKTAKEVHVIPPIDNLNPADPLADLLKSVIREEQSKLEALQQPSAEPRLSDEPCVQLLTSVPSLDCRQSLSILGDVASRAVPLQNTTSPSKLSLLSINSNIERITSDVSPCTPAKPLIVYSLPPSYSLPASNSTTNLATVVPYHFYVLPALNIESTIPPVQSSSAADSGFNLPCSDLENDGFSEFNAKQASFCGSSVSKCNAGTGALSSALKINVLKSSKLIEGNLINQSQDYLSNFSLQENYVTQVETNEMTYDESQMYAVSMQLSKSQAVDTSQQNDHFVHSEETQSMLRTSYLELPNNPKLSKAVELEGNINLKFLADQSGDSNVLNIDYPLLKAIDQRGSVTAVPSNSELLHPAVNDSTLQSAIPLHSKEANSDCHSEEQTGSSRNSLIAPARLVSSKENVSISLKRMCSICGKQFSSSSCYNRHLQVHSDEKPHKCLHCGKLFRFKSNLTVHLRSHTGARPYKCPICQKKLRYRTELKEHQQSHEGTQLIKCPDCGQMFRRKRDLTRHSLSHHSAEKATCHICKKSFARLDYMRRHLKSHRKFSDVFDKTSQGQSVQLSVSPKRNINVSSEDLISLAFQAAEDGVEFMFIEQVEPSGEDNQGSDANINNIMFVQTLEQDQMSHEVKQQ